MGNQDLVGEEGTRGLREPWDWQELVLVEAVIEGTRELKKPLDWQDLLLVVAVTGTRELRELRATGLEGTTCIVLVELGTVRQPLQSATPPH